MENVKYFFHVKPSPISDQIKQLIVAHFEQLGDSGRKKAKKIGISATLISAWKKPEASIKLNTLEKVLITFSELRGPVAELLLGEPIKKGTEATNSDEAPVDPEELKRRMESTIRYLQNQNSQLLNIVELALKRGGTDGAD